MSTSSKVVTWGAVNLLFTMFSAISLRTLVKGIVSSRGPAPAASWARTAAGAEGAAAGGAPAPAATAAAFAGAVLAPAPLDSPAPDRTPISVPTGTVVPSAMAIDSSTPSAGEGISTLIL